MKLLRLFALLGLALLAATPNFVIAQSSDEIFTKLYEDGGIYTGTFRGGLQHGTGTYQLPNGYVYTGNWVGGVIVGHGVAQFPNGSVYEGEFARGKPEGVGRITFADGSSYEGHWRDGQMDGRGSWKLAKSGAIDAMPDDYLQPMSAMEIYAEKGIWVDGEVFEQGLELLPRGSHYEGDFARGHPYGFGKITYVDGNVSTGRWRTENGVPHFIVEATAHGALTPQGVMVFSGPPPIIPRLRPSNMAAIVAATEKAEIAAQTVRPTAPSAANVSQAATQQDAIPLREINLIGVYGSPGNRRALIRQANGRFQMVVVGDRVDGGSVTVIEASKLYYSKGGESYIVELTDAPKTSDQCSAANTDVCRASCNNQFPENCSDSIVCSRAAFGAGSKRQWFSHIAPDGSPSVNERYITEARSRGLSCGVAAASTFLAENVGSEEKESDSPLTFFTDIEIEPIENQFDLNAQIAQPPLFGQGVDQANDGASTFVFLNQNESVAVASGSNTPFPHTPMVEKSFEAADDGVTTFTFFAQNELTELGTTSRAELEVAPLAVPVPQFRPVLQRPLEAFLKVDLIDVLAEDDTLNNKSSSRRNPLMVLTTAELDTFRREVMKCWTIEPGSAELRVPLVVSFDMTPEGKPISGSIGLVSSNLFDKQDVERAFQSARRAILRCGAKGYTLPTTKYESWKTVELSFVPF